MGQATVDLPGPLETPSASTTVGADDLLAQMAGDEIDRLLAEAEADAPTVRTAPAIEDPQVPPPFDSGAVSEKASSSPATGEAARAAGESNLAGELDSLLESLTTASPPPPDPEPASPAVQAVDAEEAAATPASAAGTDVSGETSELLSAAAAEAVATGEFSPPGEATSAAERSALSDASALEAPLGEAMPAAAIDGELDQDASLPLLLKPLEWINAPLAACPDFLREFIGKAAILTVVNAGAILFYVRFVRRH